MAFDSFKQFIDQLDRAGELIRIAPPVATELEITELADRRMKSPGGGKALLIEKPTVNGQVSPFPLAINTMGSWKRMALSLGANSVDEVAAELGSLMKARPPTSFREALKLLSTAMDLRHARPKVVKDGPCREVIHRFDPPPTREEPWPPAPKVPFSRPPDTFSPSVGERDGVRGLVRGEGRSERVQLETRNPKLQTLLNLPIQKCWPLDGGRFITLPCVVTRDPDTGERNVGMYRMQIYDERTTGMHWQLQKVGARHGRRYYETGTRMPVAVFLGGDPVFAFAATAPLPDGLDEFLLAGYLRKKSVELIKCETNDLEVPANADFVIEGYVDPREPLREEGPFGDHTGYYTLPEPYPVFHVTAITHRKDAVYPATIVGMPPMEDFYIGSASVKLFLPIFKMNFPEIVDIALPAEGVFHNLVFVSIKKTYPMQAYKIMHGLWGMGQMMFTKYIVVVDDDVDVHNTSEVLFRLCANTDPQRDSIFTKGPADVLDHATSEIAVGSKLGIDATKKLPGEGFKRAWPPLIKMDDTVKAKVEKLFGVNP
ncbi:MAG: UbiD family decarboxylase [Verrucomicrobia bacterium]|nr:UbiD family decarboxylase [Verrucomicrobiota bacterium]